MNLAVVVAALLGGLSLAIIVLSIYHGVQRNGERQEEILTRLSEVEGLLRERRDGGDTG